jgi:DHA2 family multidrug resistance protein
VSAGSGVNAGASVGAARAQNDAVASEQGWHPGHNPWAVALTVTIATFMEVLDTSIANVTLPHIAGNLSVGQDESTWVLTSYLVSNAIVLPISGWIATKVGRKRFYMTCVALFTISSFMCGIAPSLPLLIFFRVLQGVGGGGLGPSEQAILADTFPPAQRGMAFAVYGMAVVVAPAVGPTLGGWITDHYTWRWVFFINVPVGILSLFLSHRMVSDPPYLADQREHAGPIDFVGLVLIAIGLGCLEVVLDKGQEDDWFASNFIVVFAAVAAVALVAFVWWELRQKYPVVNLRMLASRNFGSANFMMLILGATLFGTTVLLPLYLQVIMGYTAQLAGMALSPGAVLIIGLMPIVGALVSRVDSRRLIAFGFAVLSLSLFYMAHHLYPGIDFGTAVKLRMYQAAGLAFLFVPINTIAYTGVAPGQNNAASGIINLSRNMGGDLGIALATTMIARRAQVHQSRLVAHVTPFDTALSQRTQALTQAFVHAGSSSEHAARQASAAIYRALNAQAQTLAYVDVMWLFACVTACMIPLVFVMRKAKAGRRVGH